MTSHLVANTTVIRVELFVQLFLGVLTTCFSLTVGFVESSLGYDCVIVAVASVVEVLEEFILVGLIGVDSDLVCERG